MKVNTEHQTLSIFFSEDLFIDFNSDWLQIFGAFNWYSFHFITAYFENDKWTGGIECEVWLLGFGVRLRWNYNPLKLEEMEK